MPGASTVGRERYGQRGIASGVGLNAGRGSLPRAAGAPHSRRVTARTRAGQAHDERITPWSGLSLVRNASMRSATRQVAAVLGRTGSGRDDERGRLHAAGAQPRTRGPTTRLAERSGDSSCACTRCGISPVAVCVTARTDLIARVGLGILPIVPFVQSESAQQWLGHTTDHPLGTMVAARQRVEGRLWIILGWRRSAALIHTVDRRDLAPGPTVASGWMSS
jgi:hypothetical protein